ncbi:M48 family metallopeptidase [Patescibacteria group bacterium]|nr:M48 family metallopeptidase [Patescibacteria group bacterium]MBU1123127.1 M48 family metallopeptidase [Patescibacteria group bacterium]MBU1911045.1 M48 family metallopeptidase [Patescibacteria group bacterium]
MKQSTFTYGTHNYDYYLIRQDRKTVSLTVQPSLNIILKCPKNYTQKKIDIFLKRKWYWLERQLKDLRRLQRSKAQKEYISGESFIYLGRQYKLIVKGGASDSVGLEKGKIIVKTSKDVSNKSHNQKLLEEWYTNRGEKVFNERYRQVLKKFDYEFAPELQIRKMSKRWGSFLAKKKVLLNPDLIKASKECIDYVITHEMCHMKHHDHSTAYFRFLNSKFPNWEKTKETLELRFL